MSSSRGSSLVLRWCCAYSASVVNWNSNSDYTVFSHICRTERGTVVRGQPSPVSLLCPDDFCSRSQTFLVLQGKKGAAGPVIGPSQTAASAILAIISHISHFLPLFIHTLRHIIYILLQDLTCRVALTHAFLQFYPPPLLPLHRRASCACARIPFHPYPSTHCI